MQRVVDCYDTRLQNVFEAYARIFVCVNALTPVSCVDNILMNLVSKWNRQASNKLVWCKKIVLLKGLLGGGGLEWTLPRTYDANLRQRVKRMCLFTDWAEWRHKLWEGTENGSCLGPAAGMFCVGPITYILRVHLVAFSILHSDTNECSTYILHFWDNRCMFSVASDSDKVLAKRLRTRSKLLLVEFTPDCSYSGIGNDCTLLNFRSRGKFFVLKPHC